MSSLKLPPAGTGEGRYRQKSGSTGSSFHGRGPRPSVGTPRAPPSGSLAGVVAGESAICTVALGTGGAPAPFS